MCICFEIQINGHNQKRWRQTELSGSMCWKTNANSGFHWEFNKPHQKHNITQQNLIFVSPESYKSQHEIHQDFTLLSYKSPDNTLNISQTKNKTLLTCLLWNTTKCPKQYDLLIGFWQKQTLQKPLTLK